MSLIKKIYNKFQPFYPLLANDPAYVNCSEVRGDDNIFREIGKIILFSDQPTCQLYTGHRGVGKSTELLRLEDYLQKNGCFVVYFSVTAEDIDEIDTQYTDILLACTRNIVDNLKEYASPNPLLNWLESRWTELKDLALSEVEFEKLTVEAQIQIFSKLTTTLRRIPSTRKTIREQVDNYSVSLITALNEFLKDAQDKLPDDQLKIVMIADDLDRIIPLEKGNNRTSHEEIFLDYSSQLTALNCHVVYTVPISLAYSSQATELRNIYATPQVLPMIMVKNRDNQSYSQGLDKLKEIIEKRVHLVDPTIDIDTKIFDSQDSRIELCSMTGGHVRELMLLMQSVMRYIDDFPITTKIVRRAVSDARDSTYRNAVSSKEWPKLAEVSLSKTIPNDEYYRSLLFRRCLLEYREFDAEYNSVSWYDVHPLIEGTSEFKSAVSELINK
ncbi:P-loop NTPase fold protein [Moorena bouillonii]|uniref:Pilus assembly protein PilB n=1 Tax=Moorena bouillonii PNG TaxID=568701 RepID=A0A1U7N5J6_9CYAN|nr:P-loop NTPase fold protein [Moorena bouillonii]OLT61196.1 pilus assembly protein PilB [Moorena bouillonii PNG]